MDVVSWIRRKAFAVALELGVCLFCLQLAACRADWPVNPSFQLTGDQARIAWREMEVNPKAVGRPVVVLGGIYDPGFAADHIADQIRSVTPTPVIEVSFFETCTFENCAAKLVKRVDASFPSNDPEQTIEIDVIAFSMGGLVARVAANAPTGESPERKRLRIHRLFTIVSPHRGANLAWMGLFDRRVSDMRAGSAFLDALNHAPRDYEILPYARLEDWVVGEENAAPPGQSPWWLPRSFTLSHMLAGHDVRILTDIARRLRSETPFTTEPAAGFPGEEPPSTGRE